MSGKRVLHEEEDVKPPPPRPYRPGFLENFFGKSSLLQADLRFTAILDIGKEYSLDQDCNPLSICNRILSEDSLRRPEKRVWEHLEAKGGGWMPGGYYITFEAPLSLGMEVIGLKIETFLEELDCRLEWEHELEWLVEKDTYDLIQESREKREKKKRRARKFSDGEK